MVKINYHLPTYCIQYLAPYVDIGQTVKSFYHVSKTWKLLFSICRHPYPSLLPLDLLPFDRHPCYLHISWGMQVKVLCARLPRRHRQKKGLLDLVKNHALFAFKSGSCVAVLPAGAEALAVGISTSFRFWRWPRIIACPTDSCHSPSRYEEVITIKRRNRWRWRPPASWVGRSE